MKKDILKHWALTAQIAVNALIGYLFMKFLASNWGASSQKDAFDAAYSIPFLLLSVSGFSFFESIITLKFSTMRGEDVHKVRGIFSAILRHLLLLSMCLVGGTAVFSLQITDLLVPGLQASAKHDAQGLLLLFMPLVLILGLGSFFSAVLTAYGIPVSIEMCQLISRLGVVGGWLAVGYAPSLNQVAISLCVFGAGALLLMWLVAVRVTGVTCMTSPSRGSSEVRNLIIQGAGLLATSVLAQGAMAFLRRQASLDGIGTIAMFTYAFALIYPLSVLMGKPMALVLGPRYIRYMSGGQFSSARGVLLWCCVGLLLTTVTISSVICANAQEVVGLLFGGGAFDASTVIRTGGLLELAIWGLPAEAISRVLLLPLLNDGKTHAVSIIYSARYVLQIALTYALFSHWGRNGLVWSYVLAVVAQVFLEAIYLSYQLKRKA